LRQNKSVPLIRNVAADRLPGVIPSPNIWRWPDTYEVENRSVDPAGLLDKAIQQLHPLAGATVLDIGCGTGYHLPHFATTAARVIGVEPHPPLLRLARRRLRSLPLDLAARIELYRGTAQLLPVPDASVDVVHARWAYFFGPGCEPGLAEVARVLRPGGTAIVIDNDATQSTFGRWFRAGLPTYDPVAVERFWAFQGFTRVPITIRWAMPSRHDFEAVVRIEFAPDLADRVLAEHQGCEVDYAVNLWWRRVGPFEVAPTAATTIWS
jgi:ubiquinone/menaquinone biosynthesis C-methylase UbiE